jgi:hypothetical protein
MGSRASREQVLDVIKTEDDQNVVFRVVGEYVNKKGDIGSVCEMLDLAIKRGFGDVSIMCFESCTQSRKFRPPVDVIERYLILLEDLHYKETHPPRIWIRRCQSQQGFDFFVDTLSGKSTDIPPCIPEYKLQGRYFFKIRDVFRGGFVLPLEDIFNRSIRERDSAIFRLCLEYDTYIRNSIRMKKSYEMKLESHAFVSALKILAEHGKYAREYLEYLVSEKFMSSASRGNQVNAVITHEFIDMATNILQVNKAMFDLHELKLLRLYAMCIERCTRTYSSKFVPSLRVGMIRAVFNCLIYRINGKYMWVSYN